MADRTYYAALAFGAFELKRLAMVADEVDGPHAADILRGQDEARAQIKTWVAGLIGVDGANELDQAWVLDGTQEEDVVPVQIRRIARLLGSSYVHAISESHKGRRGGEDSKRTIRSLSVVLLEAALAEWERIAAGKLLALKDGTLVDLTSYLSEDDLGGFGIEGGGTTFFGDRWDEKDTEGQTPVYSLQGAFLEMMP